MPEEKVAYKVCARPDCREKVKYVVGKRAPKYCSQRCCNTVRVRNYREKLRYGSASVEPEVAASPPPRVVAGHRLDPDATPVMPEFNPAQEGFFKDVSPLCLYSGAFGAGKTHILCLKALALALKYHKNFLLLCRKEFASMRQTTIRKFLELAEPYDIDYNKTEQIVTFPDRYGRSQVLFSGLDDPQRIASLEVAWIGIDESIELEESDWMMLSGRLRHRAMPFRQMAAVSNPCIPGSHQHKMFFDRKEGNVYHSTALDNKFNPDDFATRLEMFKGIYYDRYVMGKCVGAEGLVYDCYDPSVHVIDPFDIPADWPRYMGIDLGYAAPFAALWAARQPHGPTEHFPFTKGSLFVYREVYRRHELAENHARRLRELTVRRKDGEVFPERIEARWADHDAEDRATLNAHGIGTMPAFKQIQVGIQSVYRRLMRTVLVERYKAENPGDLSLGVRGLDEKTGAGLYFFRDISVDRDAGLVAGGLPTGLLDEFGGYTWQPASEGRSAKEAPRKDAHDHALDALRYLVMGVERGSERPVVFL